MQNYVASCNLCMETNIGHSPKIPLNLLEIPSAPFQIIHVDLLKFHTPSRGNKYGWSKTLYKLLGVKSIKTSAYKPTTNSQCERTNHLCDDYINI